MIKFSDTQFKNLIKKYLQIFHNEYSCKPIIGLELEFYINNKKNIEPLTKDLSTKKIHYSLTKETGNNQYEIQLPPSMQILKKLNDLTATKQSIINIPGSTLAAKPFANQPGNAIHMHLNFVDKNHNNLFDKFSNYEESTLLLHCVAGLLETLPEAMYFLAPNDRDYARYQASIETPSNISWGNNNRTVAIRIPSKESGPRRIEHRIASAESNPLAICVAIFAGCIHGLKNKLQPPQKIYGNAYLPQYQLEHLPTSINSAYNHLTTKQNLLSLML